MIPRLGVSTTSKAITWLEDRVALGSEEAKMLKEILGTFAAQQARYEITVRTLLNILRLHQDDPLIPREALVMALVPVKEIIANFPQPVNGKSVAN